MTNEENQATPEVAPDSLSDAQLDALYEQAGNEPETPVGETPEAEEAFTGTVGESAPTGGAASAGDPEAQAAAQEGERTVPLAALHEERAKRKEMKQQIDMMEQRFQQMVQYLQSQNQPVPEEEARIPEIDENPVEHFKQRVAQLEKVIENLSEGNKQRTETEQKTVQWNNFVSAYTQDSQRLAQQDPEWPKAYQFWTESKMAEYQAGGATPEQARRLIENEEVAAAQYAFSHDENPADRVYAICKARGYKPQATSGPDLDAIAKGQAQAAKMPAGGQPSQGLTLEALSQMNDEDFEKNWSKVIG